MLNLQDHAAAIESSLGVDSKVTHDQVMQVLELIEERHPEVTDQVLEDIREGVAQAIRNNIAWVDRGALHMMVIADLEEKKTLVTQVIPEDIDMPRSILDKLEELDVREDLRKVSAYIILNATSTNDLGLKLGAAHWGCDQTQFLMPMLHKLIKKQPEVRARVVQALRGLEIFQTYANIPDLMDQYCFDEENTQPYMIFLWLTPDQGVEVPAPQKAELKEKFILTMLEIIREYIQG